MVSSMVFFIKIVNNINFISEFEITSGGYGLEFLGNIYLDSEDLYKKSVDTGITLKSQLFLKNELEQI